MVTPNGPTRTGPRILPATGYRTCASPGRRSRRRVGGWSSAEKFVATHNCAQYDAPQQSSSTNLTVNEMAENYAEMFKVYGDNLLAPMVKLNKLNVANLEKLVALQIESLSALSSLGIGQLKALVDVRDVDGVKVAAEQQVEYVRTVGEKLVADSKTVVELAKVYSADVQRIAQEGADAVVVKAA